MRLSHTIVRNSAFGFAAQLAIKLLSFAFSVLIIRRLAEGEYGQYAAVLAYGMIFAFVCDLGLSPYTVREVARYREAKAAPEAINRLFASVLVLRLVLSIGASALLVGTVWFSGQPAAMVVAVSLCAIGYFTYSIHGTSEAFLAGFERLDLAAGTKVLSQLVFVVGGGAALLLWNNYFGLVVANQVGIAIMALVAWRAVRRLGVGWDAVRVTNWPALLRASLPFGVIGFTLGLSYKFDTLLLNQTRTDQEVGYYNAAYNLVFSAVMFSNVINTSLFPSLTRQAVGNPQSLSAIYSRSLRYLLIAALPVAVGGCLLATGLVEFLYGARYAPAADALRIVIWVTPLMFASEFLGYVVLIRGEERYAARSVLVSTAVNVGLNLLVVPVYGFRGAAVMTVLTEATLVALYVWRLRGVLATMDWTKTLLLPLLAALLMGLFVLAVAPWVHVLVAVALGGAVYALLLVALRVIGGDELRFVRSLRSGAEV